MHAAVEPAIAFRHAEARDEEFLYEVYASTRIEELQATGWSAVERETFLRSQFAAQSRYYHQHYTNTDYLVITCRATPVGRLYVARWTDEIRIVDVAILPAHRGRGIGTRVLETVLREAAQARKPVRIHMERFNRALRWYERLGFRVIEDRGVYLFMEWTPET